MHQKIEKNDFVSDIIAFELVPTDSPDYEQNTCHQ